MRDSRRGLRCNAWLGRRLSVDGLHSCFIAVFLALYSSLSLASCCSCLICALPAAATLLAGVLLFIFASPSTALARAGRLLQRQLYRSAAIQSKLSHRLRVVVLLGDSGIGHNQPLDVPAILYLISLVH